MIRRLRCAPASLLRRPGRRPHEDDHPEREGGRRTPRRHVPAGRCADGDLPARRARLDTLVPTSNPTKFYRIDQAADTASSAGWSKARTFSGRIWQASGRVTVGADGDETVTTSSSPVDAALKVALAETGARTAMGAGELMGIVFACIGGVVAVGAVVFALVVAL